MTLPSASILALALATVLPGGVAPGGSPHESSQDPSQLPQTGAPKESPLAKALRTHAFLGRLKTDPGQPCTPYLLFIEKPRRADPGHLERINAMYAPWLAKLGEVFDTEFIAYNKLERKETALLPVYVLSSPAGMRNAARYETAKGRYGPAVVFVDEPGVVVTYYDGNLARRPAHVVRHPLLVAAATHLIGSNLRTGDGAPQERWLIDGLALYLSGHGEGSEPADLADPAFDAAALERLKPLLANPEQREAFLVPLGDLIDARTDAERTTLVRRRALDGGLQVPSVADVDRMLQDQSALWVHFLMRGRGGRYRAPMQRYVAKALHGQGSSAEFVQTLGTGAGELYAEYLTYLDTLAGGGVVAGAAPSVQRRRDAEEGVLHGELVVDLRDADDHVALALGRARGGAFEAAVTTLEDALEFMRSDDRERVSRELERLRAVVVAREAFVEDFVERRGKLRLSRGKDRATVQVTGHEEGALQLEANEFEIESLPIEEISAFDLGRSMGKKLGEYGPAWIGPYTLLLAGDKRWDRKLEGDDAGLREDAYEMPALVRRGVALVQLDELCRRPVPVEAIAARVLALDVAAIWGESGDVEAVKERKQPLRDLATEAWKVVYARDGVQEVLAGDVKRLSDGKVRVSYTFDEPEQAADFVTLEGYLESRRKERFELPSGLAGKMVVKAGNYEGLGAQCFRHKLSFKAPTVRYDFLYARSTTGGDATILVGLCDDGKESYVGGWDLFDLEAYDKPSGHARTSFHEGERMVEPIKTHKLELRHDGRGKVAMHVNGKKVREVETGPLQEGYVFVWIHATVPIAIKKIEIEGHVAIREGDSTRAAWVAERLTEGGLGD